MNDTHTMQVNNFDPAMFKRTALTTAFLAQAEAKGYKPYVDSLKRDDNLDVPNFYLGSVQLRMRDDIGTRYFVNVDMFDVSALTRRPEHLVTTANVQFHVDEDNVVDVSQTFTDLDKVEALFDDMWRKMSFGYYSKD